MGGWGRSSISSRVRFPLRFALSCGSADRSIVEGPLHATTDTVGSFLSSSPRGRAARSRPLAVRAASRSGRSRRPGAAARGGVATASASRGRAGSGSAQTRRIKFDARRGGGAEVERSTEQQQMQSISSDSYDAMLATSRRSSQDGPGLLKFERPRQTPTSACASDRGIRRRTF